MDNDTLLEVTVSNAEKTLVELYQQGEHLNNITIDLENMDQNLSISERILSSIKSILYRITYRKEPQPMDTAMDTAMDMDMDTAMDTAMDTTHLGQLRTMNITINEILSHQNNQLKTIDENMLNNCIKLDKIKDLFNSDFGS
jgi:hypothetical protein